MGLAAIDETAEWIRRNAPAPPRVAVVLGSGLSEALDPVPGAREFAYSEVPHFPISSVPGHAGRLLLGEGLAVMKGRVHFYEGHDPDRVVFPLRALARAGARVLLLTNAVGAIRRDLKPGALTLIRDHINLMGMNPLRGPNLEGLGPRFPDLTAAYDPGLRRILKAAARKLRIPLPESVFAAFSGPSYETPAEIRALRRLGADTTGMSVVPETIAGVHAGMRVAAISCVANPAAGLARRPLTHDEVIEVTARAKDRLGKLLRAALPALG